MFGVLGKLFLLTAWGCFGASEINAQKISGSSFSCDGRIAGYYADMSTGCEVYHMCDGQGRQFSYKCPSKTLFQQRMLICDHWYMVNCSKAEEDYGANLLIGQQGRAFVEDLQYSRTPRPDLIDPSHSDFNTYRVGNQPPKNILGVSEDADARGATVDEVKYSLLNERVEYPSVPTTVTPSKGAEISTNAPGLVKQIYYRTSYNSANKESNDNLKPKGKVLSLNSVFRKDNTFNGDISTKTKLSSENKETVKQGDVSPTINFPSSFKATTPVYPKHLDIDMSKFFEFGDPIKSKKDGEIYVNFASNYKATTPVYPQHVDIDPSKLSEFDIPITGNAQVNFPSKFKATTPVYPLHIDVDPSKLSEFDIPIKGDAKFSTVNFESKFKATTPVYPKQVDVDLTKFQEFEEQPPAKTSGENVVVNFASNFKATTPVYPLQVDVDQSKFLEPVELPLQNDNKNLSVNFGSNFKATTPVFPLSVEPTASIPLQAGLLPPLPHQQQPDNKQKESDNSSQVNVASNFQATTPNYPNSVEPTSPDPSEIGLLPPLNGSEKPPTQGQPDISLDFVPPKFEKTFNKRIDEDDPFVLGNTFNSKQLTEFMLTMKPEQLKDLRNMWHIPDYDFPLEFPSRPSYDSDFSSFQAKSANKS